MGSSTVGCLLLAALAVAVSCYCAGGDSSQRRSQAQQGLVIMRGLTNRFPEKFLGSWTFDDSNNLEEQFEAKGLVDLTSSR
jgi:hypothetical protein